MSRDPEALLTRPSRVSVVIPAYNAEGTIRQTLCSVLAQTFVELEVLVVDDGSEDGTHAIARQFADSDPRVRVIRRRNSGVADTRNEGLLAARSPLVAPIDADDLWHPTHVEKLHRALTTAGEGTLFAFANFRTIDADDCVLGSAPQVSVQGHAFHRFLVKNFVGNGSGMMFHRDAALAVGGYERRLQHEFGAQGCEDWLLQSRLAARGGVVSVGEYLVGYRRLAESMSSDQVKMGRSRIHALEILFSELGWSKSLSTRWAIGRAIAESMLHELRAGNFRRGSSLLPRALATDPSGTIDAVLTGGVRVGVALARRAVRLAVPRAESTSCGPSRRRFFEFAPTEGLRPMAGGLLRRRLQRLAPIDAEGPPAPLPATRHATSGPRKHGSTHDTPILGGSRRHPPPGARSALGDLGARAHDAPSP